MAVRNTQQPTEILEAPTTARVRLTQAPAEILEAPTTGQARLTQLVVEILVGAKTGFPMMTPGIWPGVILTGGIKTKRQPRK